MDADALLLTMDLESLEDTERLGRLLAEHLPAHACVGLTGTLGAGKTTLAQAFIAAHGIERSEITSPTFNLLRTYPTPTRTIHHMDAYRIRDEDEFFELGVEELLEDPSATTLVEWAGKVAGCLPLDCLWIGLEWHADQTRRVEFRGAAARWRESMDVLATLWRANAP